MSDSISYRVGNTPVTFRGTGRGNVVCVMKNYPPNEKRKKEIALKANELFPGCKRVLFRVE